MPELTPTPQIRHDREYSVSDIRRLAERFRHLAKDFSEVFIVASRQAIVHRVETDPDEEETRQNFRFFDGLKKRFLERRRRLNYSKPQLVAAKPVKAEIEQPVSPKITVEKAAQIMAQAQPYKDPGQKEILHRAKVDSPEKKPAQPAPATVSLFEAAAGYRATLDQRFQLKTEETAAPVIPTTSVLKLSEEERPKYKKYRDIGEQLLAAKQLPHFRTLLEKARTELSADAIELLRELGKEHGFNG